MRDFGYTVRPPPAPLAGLVDHLWALRDTPAHTRESVVPSGTCELVINLHEDELRVQRTAGAALTRLGGAVVSGAYGEPFVVESRAHASILGVHFAPGGAAAFLGVPADALADTHVELETLWGRRACELRERLCATRDADRRFRLLEAALLAALSGTHRLRGEIAVALTRLGAPGVRVGQVAAQVSLSHRRFIALFSEQVGMTPKRYAMVRRFQRALAQATAERPTDWVRVALECGYADQAHLCHDWLAFTGLSPAELLRRKDVQVKDNHVALPEPPGSRISKTRPPAAPSLS